VNIQGGQEREIVVNVDADRLVAFKPEHETM
jgi:hypothetical protein